MKAAASIGRIVIYNHPGSADWKYPAMQSPAVAQAVYDYGTVCDLFVMSVTGGIFFAKGVRIQDDTEGSSWKWPERV